MNYESSIKLRLLYCLAILSAIFPFGMSGWVSMTVGPNLLSVPYIGPISLLFIGIWRIYKVTRYPHTLDSYVQGLFLKALRVIGIIGMSVGVVYFVLRFGANDIVHMWVPSRSESGVEYYVVGVYLSLIGGMGSLGVFLFEASRLFGFERQRKSTS